MQKNTLAHLQNASNAAEPTRQILATVLHVNNSTSYINGSRASRSRQHLLFTSSTVQLSGCRHIHPRLHKTWAQAASQPATPTDPHSVRPVLETVKSILAVFDIQNLCETVRALVLQLQTISVPLSKIMVVHGVLRVHSNPQY